MEVVSLILAGGQGTRLWPISRKSFPKQFLELNTKNSLLQEASQRLNAVIPYENQMIITNQEYYNLVKMQLNPDVHIMVESEGKNTAPAILWAALKIQKEYGNDVVMFVTPSDQVIKDDDIFVETVRKAIETAKENKIVVFGIRPEYPETGFGYIEVNAENVELQRVYPVAPFKEKPDYDTAIRYYKSGGFFWNSGIFVFSVGTILEEFKKCAPELYQVFCNIAIENNEEVAAAYRRCTGISMDYAIMEKTEKAYVIPSNFGWNDLGSWKSFYSVKKKDSDGNVKVGNILEFDTKNSLLYSNDKLMVTLGLDNIIILSSDDALVVSDMDNIHKLGKALEYLKAENNRLLVENKTMVRPWGSYTVLSEGDNFKVKKLDINVNAKVSMQMHHHRSEHWTVVRGTAKITVNGKVQYLHENESILIPKTTKHRLENDGKILLEIIEVQCGLYLGEDDIVRFDENDERV